VITQSSLSTVYGEADDWPQSMNLLSGWVASLRWGNGGEGDDTLAYSKGSEGETRWD